MKTYNKEKNEQLRREIAHNGITIDLTPERKAYIVEGISNLAASMKAMGCVALIAINFKDGSEEEEGISALVGSRSELNECFERLRNMANDGLFDELETQQKETR